MKKLLKPALKLTLGITTIFFLIFAIALIFYLTPLNKDVTERFSQKKFISPVEYYARSMEIKTDQILNLEILKTYFIDNGFREILPFEKLKTKDFFVLSAMDCKNKYNQNGKLDELELFKCIGVKNKHTHIIGTSKNQQVKIILKNPPSGNISDNTSKSQQLKKVSFSGKLFAQYYNDKPIFRKVVSLGDIPVNCLNALISIEDNTYLSHKGVNLKAIFRAFLANIKAGKTKQGGSTITQQLVKNYFLTPERTLKRKLKELFISIILEWHFTKEEILETYLNLIYLGQDGTFQIRGYAAASEFYFKKKIENTNLNNCALLAAIVNSPGLYNPFNKKKNALKRRNLVLKQMQKYDHIDEADLKLNTKLDLNLRPSKRLSEPAPYFIDAVKAKLKQVNIPIKAGTKIYTSIDLSIQKHLQKVLNESTKELQNKKAYLKDLLDNKNLKLQSAGIISDNDTGQILGLVGGDSFKLSPFNRAINAKRQVGSLIKPIIYLTALSLRDSFNKPIYTSTSLVDDSHFILKQYKQTWEPKNYDGKFRGQVPFYYALSKSLNIPAVKLGLDIGLKYITESLYDLGLSKNLKLLPSLLLGAQELSVMDIQQVYLSLARQGNYIPLTTIIKVTDINDKIIFEPKYESIKKFDEQDAFLLTGMLKHNMDHGTGKKAKMLGVSGDIAGKTGTTNKNKDSWFAGYTPLYTLTIWTGFDSNIPSKLTGSSGSLITWAKVLKDLPQAKFNWPVSVKKSKVFWDPLQFPSIDVQLENNIELVLRLEDEI